MTHFPYASNLKNINDIWYDSHSELLKNVLSYYNLSDKIEEASNIFLDKTLKMKKPKKDLNAPKRNKNPYMIFSDNNREKIKTENKDLKLGDISKELGRTWKLLDEEEKEKYIKLAEKDKERYKNDLDEYNNKLYLNDVLQYSHN